ncbi:hypothetical protein [Paenibacillus mucilaginosus]|uniref:Lipoprotein n=1 Tax=Paenibacillus mucilaginosus (strain KNP414) TaxID=1036673 RepID=F8FJX3_PAEMK|nr:hypothetical protein [Paenibacillus mucilaginosus]AEI43454.1 hypothetical protein KNP414_04929 [Paenibacillus mucilaginosus KNP414]MCG7212000.1 hypothetical protein [Paenibacillus mucilaginosus]WDM25011.1 hypothetical protein KCX80_21315 [Paenibacillus mucilaginosus]WFA19683.1 hypothetical protein ERY13_21785 [Paenibacillus mucilaginosus]
MKQQLAALCLAMMMLTGCSPGGELPAAESAGRHLTAEEVGAAELVLKDRPEFPPAGRSQAIQAQAGPHDNRVDGELKTTVETAADGTHTVTLTKAWKLAVNGTEAQSVWRYSVSRDGKVELVSSEEKDHLLDAVK